MEQPKFQIGQQVKFVNDHDRMTGKVLSTSFHSANVSDKYTGWEYTISSKYYDAEINDMVEGIKRCKEEELVDMTDYSGTTDPIKPDNVINVSDTVGQSAEPTTNQ